MKSDEERKNLNYTLIPRDIGDMTKRRKQIYGRAGMPSQAPKGVAPTFLGTSTDERKIQGKTGAPEESKDSGQGSAVTDSGTDKGADEDYTKTYLKNKAAAEQQGRDEQIKNSASDAVEKNKQMTEETMLRNQARDLQNQVRMWEEKKGQQGYDDAQVDGMVASLKSQLGAIDPKYWN